MIGLVLLGTSARAESPDPSLEQGLAAVTRCMEFAGEPEGFRAWAKQTGLERAPLEIEKAYLASLPGSGQLFGYASATGQIAIASQDDGGCTLFVQHVDGDTFVSGVEQWLRENKLNDKPANVESRNSAKYAMTSRDYEVTGKRHWRLVVSTSSPSGAARFDALVTVYGDPEPK